jgi:hypothetical protein
MIEIVLAVHVIDGNPLHVARRIGDTRGVACHGVGGECAFAANARFTIRFAVVIDGDALGWFNRCGGEGGGRATKKRVMVGGADRLVINERVFTMQISSFLDFESCRRNEPRSYVSTSLMVRLFTAM